MNILLLQDAYKLSHHKMYPEGTTQLYSYMCSRGSRVDGVNKVVFFGLQYYLKRYLMEPITHKDKEQFIKYVRQMLGDAAVSPKILKDIDQLIEWGYLPLEIRALPEGSEIGHNIAMFTVTNTHPDFFWLTNFVETILSKCWASVTAATTSLRLRRLMLKYSDQTCDDNSHVDFQAHNFSDRGMSSVESAQISGAAHQISFLGTDNVCALPFLDEYYGGSEGYSVSADEHSIVCSYGRDYEFESYVQLLDKYPVGILSLVSDTYDYFGVLTEFLPELKDKILSRDGKCVVRPDCLDDQSKILTDSGWKYFKDLSNDDLVAQVLEDKTYDFVKPTRIIDQEYEGDMYHITDFHGKIDLMVTPDHRCVAYRLDGSEFIRPAKDFKPTTWERKKLRSPSTNNHGDGISWYERFLIAVQADGCIKKINKNGSYYVSFDFKKERKHLRLLNILNHLNFHYVVSYPPSRGGQSNFAIRVPSTFSVYKTFEWVDTANLNYEWANDFIEELKYWDSNIRNPGRFKYDSTVKENLDKVELVAIAAGKGVLISEYQDDRKEIFSDVFTAHIMDDPYAGGQSLTKTKVQYKGRIYCVEVPSGKILVKRNRGVCVTGNSSPKTPLEIVCGDPVAKYDSPEHIGTLELLWDIFGGTVNSKGYRVLDPHIGLIYGDAISYEMADKILTKMQEMGFASSNIVFGAGSWTFQYVTRDTYSHAIKASSVVVNGERRDIFKDPKTGKAKKSAKGLLAVYKDDKGEFYMKDQCTPEEVESPDNLMKIVFYKGITCNEQTFYEIRERLHAS